MGRLSKEERLNKVHYEAVTEFDSVQGSLRDERLQCLKDRRFYSIAGAQWEGPLGDQFENKPKIEVNKTHLAVIRIINEYRNNRISAKFDPKDGSPNNKLADSCASLYRADEQDSCAEEAYDNAFEEGVGGGFGAYRLRTKYEDEEDDEDERQRIIFEPIYDADSSVFFDLNAKRQDKSDAKRCWVLTSMTIDSFIEEWGDDPATWPKDIHQLEFDWLTPDVVYVAEYYVVEMTKETVFFYRSLLGEERKVTSTELEEDEGLQNELEATGWRLVRQKNRKRRRVHKYIMSGNKILEDCGFIAGKYIPVVPFYGKRWFIDNIERCMGHVRLATDPQRLKNMQLSKLAEYAAVSSISKPIFTPEQIAGHQWMWAEDNIKNNPYLLINSTIDLNGNPVPAGPQAYTQAPEIPPAMAALLQLTEQDMQEVLGNQQAAEEITPNTSGYAIELVQNKLDMQSFIYISNFAKTQKRAAEIWLSMAKEVYVEEGRKMKGVGLQGEVSQVELLKPTANEKDETEYENDLSKADFDVSVSVGPSSQSQRQSTVRALSGIMALTDDPETKQVIGAMIMMNMDGEGIDNVREYFRRKLIKMGVEKPTEEEAAELQAELENTPPDPNAIFLQASAAQAQAQAGKAQADTELALAKVDESKAKTMETLANIDVTARDQSLRTLEVLHEQNNPGGSPPSA